MKRENWMFSDYIEEIVALSEIVEIPGMLVRRNDLIREVWERFPVECEQLGLVEV